MFGIKITEDLTATSGCLKRKNFEKKKERIFVQHVHVREKLEQQNINQLRTGVFTDTLTSIDIQEYERIQSNSDL